MEQLTTKRPHGQGTLSTLRTLARQPSNSRVDARRVAESQAELLCRLANSPRDWPSALQKLIPSLLISRITELPSVAITFWAHNRWHIQLRTGETKKTELRALLHELKHIIDHPLRRHTNALTEANWEALADHFATTIAENSEPTPRASDVTAA